MESKLKHLEFIQNVITRMNTNSFLIKGWAITLVSAIFALAAKDANSRFIAITLFATPIFWILDGFFISTERQYRDLYNQVIKKEDSEIDFSMTPSKETQNKHNLIAGILSKTLLIFYGFIILASITISFIIGC